MPFPEGLSELDVDGVGVWKGAWKGKEGSKGKVKGEGFVPAHVAFDKVVLRFDAYFKQTVHESREQYHLRRVRILYFVEDDSIAVVEPPVENSGIPQGVLIKRQRMPKNSEEFYSVRDLNLGVDVRFYGKTFRVVGCDGFTERYMRETEHIDLNPPEPMPMDPYQVARSRPTRITPTTTGGVATQTRNNDKLKRFLENDRKVLRFFCVWDDRGSMFGELREFVLHYYLVDDCIEIREVQKPNNGRDPFPILLRRQPLPKAFSELSDVNDTAKYTWRDLRIGGVVNVLGRRFLLRDCDDYTRKFYSTHLGLPPTSMTALPIPDEGKRNVIEQEIPPYNGFGSIEDSLGSCKYLVLKPPKKDFIKMLENENKVLRFVAKMESKHKEDKDRRFVISYRLADDTMTIYEPPQRNAGILGGKFMERTRILLPTSSLSTSSTGTSSGPEYYTSHHLHLGTTLHIHSHLFTLIDADEYVFGFMEEHGYPLSDPVRVAAKMDEVVKKVGRKRVEEVLRACDKGDGFGERMEVVEKGRAVWGMWVTDHEVVVLLRRFEEGVRRVNLRRIIDNL
ncbi:EF-hand domain-containing protein 1 [Borealophlyctis nickersoniae]|nr:EF-hand domain-containing protein 1 [Borealophlyctis nickersoniae]